MSVKNNPTIQIEDAGRGGTIHFKNDNASFSLWWEFAGSDAIAIIEAPTSQRWESQTGLPLALREAILSYIGEQVVAQKIAGSGYFTIAENSMTIYKK